MNNPFDDIVPRNAGEKKDEKKVEKGPKKKKSKAKAHKKLQVLSFGDEAAEIEEESQKVNEKILVDLQYLESIMSCPISPAACNIPPLTLPALMLKLIIFQ